MTTAGRAIPRRVAKSAAAADALPALDQSSPALVNASPQADVSLEPSPALAALMAKRRDLELQPGTNVGEYVTGEKLGEGGMGTVYAGVHPVIGKKVAIKLLNAGLSEDPTIVQRFVQEARSVNQIGHRNIVDIFAFGQLDDGRHYYVMEFLAGASLKRRLEEPPPLSFTQAITVLQQVCDGLQAAHVAGIIHRDLKPDNIYVSDAGKGELSVKLLDFGIAKLLRHGGDQGQTRTGMPIGTPFYMAPEQCRSKNVDARTDLYAMGIIMFEMFTGRLPFHGADYIDTVNGHLSATPPLPTDYAAMPAELESLILRCLEKDPDRRVQSAEELQAALSTLPIDDHWSVQPLPTPERVVARMNTGTPGSGAFPRQTMPSGPKRVGTTPRPTGSGRTGQRRYPTVPRRRVVAMSLGVAALFGIAGFVALERRPAQALGLELQIASDPADATVILDGRAQPQHTPGAFVVGKRDVAVRLEKEGYAPREELVQLGDGERRRTLELRLQPLPAHLRARTSAAEPTWILDGNKVGSGTALALDAVAPGRHVLRLESPGMRAREAPLDFQPAAEMQLDWPLEPTAAAAAAHETAKKKSGHHAALPDAPNLDFKP